MFGGPCLSLFTAERDCGTPIVAPVRIADSRLFVQGVESFSGPLKNGSNIMSHDDFILGYQNGRLGWSVSTLLILRLFLVGRIPEARVVIPLVGWSVGLLLLIGLTIIGFLCLPALWALLGTIILLAIFALGFVYQVGGLIVSTALIDEHFLQFALAEHALYVFTDEK